MKFCSTASGVAFATILWMSPGQSIAQPVSSSPADTTQAPDSLGDIVVTARRVEENQQTVPISVTTVSGDMLTEKNVSAVRDLQFSVPNLQIKQGNLSPENIEFIIRGQRQQLFTDENVIVYFDGVPHRPRGITLYDLHDVQALRGPQGTLFGKNSLGGAMVFTTNKPTFDTEGSMTLDYGNYNLIHGTGVLNLSVIDDKLAVRVAGNIERRDGVFKNVNPRGDDLGDRRNESFRVSVLARPTERLENVAVFDYYHANQLPSPAIIDSAPLNATGFGALVSLLTQQFVQRQSQIGGGTALVNGNLLQRSGSPFRVDLYTGRTTFATPVSTPLGPLNPALPLSSTTKAYGVSDTTTLELNDTLSLRNIFGYRYERADETQDPGGGAGMTVNLTPFLSGLGVPGLPANYPGDFINLVSRNYGLNKDVSDELQLIVKSQNLSGIVGLFYSHNDYNFRNTSLFIAGPVSLYPAAVRYYNTNVDSDSYAIFAQGTYDFSAMGADGLRLTLGARHTWDKRNFTNELFYSNSLALVQQWPAPGGVCATVAGTGAAAVGFNSASQCYLGGAKSFKALTWSVSLEYQLAQQTLVYLANRRGYKAGGVNPVTANLDFAFFGPERLTDVELGIKHQGRIGGRPYRLNVAGFYGKYKKIQTQAIIPFCVTDACTASYTDLILFNVGQATIKGVEVEASFKPTPELILDFGYSYQVGRYGSGTVIPQPRDITAPVSSTNPIDYTSGLDLDGQEFVGIPRHTMNVSVTYEPRFVPESFAKPSLNVNYAYRNKTVGNSNLGVATTPGFGVLNARLTLRDLGETQFALAFWAQNLTDKSYKLSCSDNTSIGYTACRWGDPRTYGVTGSIKF